VIRRNSGALVLKPKYLGASLNVIDRCQSIYDAPNDAYINQKLRFFNKGIAMRIMIVFMPLLLLLACITPKPSAIGIKR
jgi:hypothetical protein